jgi:hypothetical protein
MNLFQRAKQLLTRRSDKQVRGSDNCPPPVVTSWSRVAGPLALSNGLSRWDEDLPGVIAKTAWKKAGRP